MPKRITLESLLQAYEQDRMTKGDFLEAVSMLVKKLDERMGRDKGDIDIALSYMAGQFVKLRGEIEATANERGEKLSSSEKQLISRLEAKMSEIEASVAQRMSEVEDGKDADEEAMMQRMMSEMATHMEKMPKEVTDIIEKNLPQLGEKIRDGLELLQGDERLDASAIKGLEEFIKRFIPQRTFTGAMGPSVVVKSLYNQSFPETPDGVITAFTLLKAPRTPGAERIYQNRTRCHPGTSNDYTVNGRTVTFNVAPLTNDVLMYDVEF